MKIRVWLLTLCACTVDLAGVDDSTTPTSSHAVVGQAATVVNTGGAGLRLRSGPGATYAVLLVMPEGASVEVIAGPNAGWFEVTYAGSTGWAHGDYLKTSMPIGANNLLPWAPNVAFYVTQGHNSGSHVGYGAWAWDFGLPVGTPVHAAHFGTVRAVKGDSSVGGCSSAYANDANYVIVDQGNGYESLYLHLSSTAVAVGQHVQRGDLVGYSGQTGWACGPHLHAQIQLSPSNGGGTGFYNPSIHDYFYDPGYAWDPAPGELATSQNGVSNQPREPDGEAWDAAMRAASLGR
jgi:murein DD-endopeptidase MepM/ murein hydrolase activator NlpD